MKINIKCILVVLALVLSLMPTASASNINYMGAMIDAAVSGDYEAGLMYEELRNEKIDRLGLSTGKVSFEDLYWLSRLVYCEVGADWHTDELQQWVASVVLNRKATEYYADTVYEVIFEVINGVAQYQPIVNGGIYCTPNERTVKNVASVLENGSILPEDVLTQCSLILGELYTYYYDDVLGVTIYFCRLDID